MKKITLSAIIIITSIISVQAQTLNPTSVINTPNSANNFKGGYTFSYTETGTPWNGALISFGGAGNAYDCQISSDYGPNGGNHLSFRTHNGDPSSNNWNSWNEIWHSGNLNNINSDFAARTLKTSKINFTNTTYYYNPASLTKTSFIEFQNSDIDKISYIFSAIPPEYHTPGIGIATKSAWSSPEIYNMFCHPNGNVGIGTTNPDTKLSVNGNTIITATSGAWEEGINIDSPDGIWGGIKFRTIGRNGYNGNWHFGYDSVHSGVTTTGNNIYLYNGSNNSYVMTYKEDGNVGIGTKNPDSKLTVAGNIHAQEVKVTVNAGADFVFKENYDLPSLASIETFIKENNHLPEIASAKEMKENGINLSEMNIKLLQKIEEMTLYMIGFKKEIETLKQENKVLKHKINKIKKI